MNVLDYREDVEDVVRANGSFILVVQGVVSQSQLMSILSEWTNIFFTHCYTAYTEMFVSEG